MGPKNVIIGYWPREVFTDLADFATHVEWGGKVKCMSGQSCPEMGSGLFPKEDPLWSAYHGSPVTVNAAGQLEYPKDTIAINDNAQYYKAEYYYGLLHNRLVGFGGPGPKT